MKDPNDEFYVESPQTTSPHPLATHFQSHMYLSFRALLLIMHQFESLLNNFPITQLDCKFHQVKSWVCLMTVTPELVVYMASRMLIE